MCMAVGGTAANFPEGFDRLAAVTADRGIAYRDFLRAANWLQDCGVYHLLVVSQVEEAGRKGHGNVALDLIPFRVPPPPIEVINRSDERSHLPGPPVYSVADVSNHVVVSLSADGALSVMANGTVTASSVTKLRADVSSALATAHRDGVNVRADHGISFGRFVGLLYQLNDDGLEHLNLISEEPPEGLTRRTDSKSRRF
ncbi:MAG TPA: hypothetical protein VG939_21315 [Caulobacteraceae bacterium]|nr:hypothetical protein [Caulobacteraceae bacterium]